MFLSLLVSLSNAWLLISTAAPASAPDLSPKPPCNGHTLGRLWPEEANGNTRLMLSLARSGRLEICSAGDWKYQWMSPTVTLSQLQEKAALKRERR